MSDLVKRLRALDCADGATRDEAADRIAKLEAALRDAREMVEIRCMCASACVCGAVRQRIDEALS